MEKPILIEAYRTEDGDAWGIFAYGHIDPSLLTLEMINEALDHAGMERLDRVAPEHLWLGVEEDEDGEISDYPYFFVLAGTEGAIAVTGIDLQS